MTENEALEILNNECEDISKVQIALKVAREALEEIQQYREYKEIFESHFSKEALELLSDKEEFGKWLERGKWIAKRCDEINRELGECRAIGTIEEFKALKEKSVAKKPIRDKEFSSLFECPACGRRQKIMYELYHCKECGQKLDWQ